MANKAMLVSLSARAKDNQMLILDSINLEKGKTKEMARVYKNINKLLIDSRPGKTLIVLPTQDNKVRLSARNLSGITTIEARNLNLLDVLGHKNLILLKDSIGVIEKFAK